MRSVPIVAAFVALTAAAVSHAAPFERTVAAEPKGSVEISNVSGRVSVTGWDRSEVQVRGELGNAVERVDVSSNGSRTIIRVVLPRQTGWRNGSADLDVRVPEQCALDVSVVSATLQTSRLLGPQRLSSVSGDIRAELGGANFEGKTVSGDLLLAGNARPSDIRLSTISGDIVLQKSAGEVDATTVSGDLQLELNPASSVRMRTTSGDLTLRGSLSKGATVDAQTVSGEVTLRARGGFEFEATSFSGDIKNCFGAKADSSRHGPGQRLSGTTGDGEGRVRVKSMSGDVEICDR